MKIGFATANLGVHGVATFTINLSRWLEAAGHNMNVIALTPGEWWPRLAEYGVKGTCIRQQSWESMANYAKRLAAWLNAQNFELLVVNVGSINSRPLQLCLHLLHDALPVVILLRNDHSDVYGVANQNYAAWNCAVAISHKMQQVAAARFVQKTIHCIPNGIELPTETQLSERLDWTTPLRLLFVGRLEDRQKGIFRLPALLSACRTRQIPVQLSVIGDGPDRDQLSQLFTATGNSNQVELYGFQAYDAVLAAMRRHHVLLLPSNFEGLANVLLEAQANGCVPVAARLPGVTDFALKEGVSGILVCPDDINDYVHGIERLLVPTEWRTFCTAGIELMQQRQSIRNMGERYLTLFEEARQGVYPLAIARSRLRQQGVSPFRWGDYFPRSLQRRLQKIIPTLLTLKRQIGGWA